MTDTVEEELLDVVTDTVEEELLDVVTDMVAGAMASCFSVACMPARLCLKSLKSFLVIAIQSTMGELLPRSKWQRPWVLVVDSCGRSKGVHNNIVILVRESISCQLRESKDIQNNLDSSSCQGLGQWAILSLLENHHYHVFQHSLSIMRRAHTLSHRQHGSAVKLSLYLKNSGVWAFSIPRKLSPPIQSVDQWCWPIAVSSALSFGCKPRVE